MKILKEGSLEEYKRKEKEEAAKKIMPWSRECECRKCGAKFEIDIDDLMSAASRSDDFDEHGWLCFCPTCEDVVDIGYVDLYINNKASKRVEARSAVLKNQKRHKEQLKKWAKKKK
jgi:Zn finger protein HypA/HybF involved in hydrogenase expression